MRLLVFLENDMYVRNFVRSGALDSLLSRHDVGVCLSEAVVKLAEAVPAGRVVGRYERSKHNVELTYHLNQISMRSLADRSATLRIKADAARASSRGKGYFLFGALSVPPVDRWAERLLGDRFFRNYDLIYSAAAAQRAFPLVRDALLRRLETNHSVEALIERHRPELVVFPVTGVEATATELVLLSRRFGFQTFFAVNGWDNLSSKGVFPLLPDYLGVWGPQSVAHAAAIQGMRPERTVLLGCARYEDYFRADRAPRAVFPHKYVLFAGATTPSDEITPLRLMDQALEDAGIRDLKVVYRPHPWREKRRCYDMFDAREYRHTIIDPQVAADYYAEKSKGTESSSSQNFPSLDYYPALVNNAVLVVSPMSSMLLEAAIFDVPSLALAHDDGCHPIPPDKQAAYEHFAGAEDVPGWFFVRDIAALPDQFVKLVRRFGQDDASNRQLRPVLSAAIQKYLFYDGRSYSARIAEAVAVIEAAASA